MRYEFLLVFQQTLWAPSGFALRPGIPLTVSTARRTEKRNRSQLFLCRYIIVGFA